MYQILDSIDTQNQKSRSTYLKQQCKNDQNNGSQSINMALTTCMAELLGGCGSMSSWEGVCPKLRIWASTAWKRHRQVCMLRGANYRQ